MKFYKTLGNAKAVHGGNFDYAAFLPKKVKGKWVAGAWTPKVEQPLICKKGYHVSTNPFKWLENATDIYEAEVDQVISQEEDKVVASSIRLLKKVEWADKPSFLRFRRKIVPASDFSKVEKELGDIPTKKDVKAKQREYYLRPDVKAKKREYAYRRREQKLLPYSERVARIEKKYAKVRR